MRATGRTGVLAWTSGGSAGFPRRYLAVGRGGQEGMEKAPVMLRTKEQRQRQGVRTCQIPQDPAPRKAAARHADPAPAICQP